MMAPDPRHPRRSQAETPLIDLSEFGQPPLRLSTAKPGGGFHRPSVRSRVGFRLPRIKLGGGFRQPMIKLGGGFRCG
jgi:hypothetical protein